MLVFLYLFFITFSEPQTIHGHIKDQSGNPLAGVRIDMNHCKTFSDNNGDFTIKSATENCQIRFSAIGYTTNIQSVKALQHELNVFLKEQSPEISQQP
ncbi:carboxypeptidase-like regulatory domain-containing protein [Aquirufa aurantiipilula]|uniref:Carboxypeptidase-like regulatory domain-containing protein n=1 Tax=Aquirufa aurantiipilula TaxID=2696561 RepID=A0ABT6BJY4_9BACT|nr:carboxypeptidase-like regulatory domain-containing protein [Aquirufa aurantiipilula]MBZ1326807.1 hypothetical protein [Aquirufa aurantiipilula]MDF5690239.1 carboxypeptidase-like regulatory domain-containing protein [Aquirufa aurantiipilula]